MILLPAICLTLRYIGPASRVVFYTYLPVEELALFFAAAGVGAGLGAQIPGWLRRSPPRAAARRWPRVFFLGLACLVGWIGVVQLRAFPSSASAGDRAAWARDHVPQYESLTRVIAAIPEVQRDVGTIVTIAPTAGGGHRAAREMNGDDMHFTLDVIGNRGSGIFHADCTLDEYRVYDWRPARWKVEDREQRIEHVSERVPGSP